jgi:hypothetical protein
MTLSRQFDTLNFLGARSTEQLTNGDKREQRS